MSRRRLGLVSVALATALGLALLAALLVGPDGASPSHLLAAALQSDEADGNATLVRTLVFELRLPRAVLAALVGAALAAAGTVCQGLFRNPMAEPGLIGISSGAALAAVVAFTLRLDALGLWVVPGAAALGATAILVVLALFRPTVPDEASLLLAGVALAGLCSALTTLLLALASEQWDLGYKVVRWLMGSFEARSWTHVTVALGPLLVGWSLCLALRSDLDALTLGGETAQSLGVDLDRTRMLALAAVALLVGTATAMCGVIGFVGLIVPHVARYLVGPTHRALLPTAALGGAVLLVLVDSATRSLGTLVLPPGAITSLLGAPFFLWLIRRRQQGAW